MPGLSRTSPGRGYGSKVDVVVAETDHSSYAILYYQKGRSISVKLYGELASGDCGCLCLVQGSAAPHQSHCWGLRSRGFFLFRSPCCAGGGGRMTCGTHEPLGS